jgi:hypothetical protein
MAALLQGCWQHCHLYSVNALAYFSSKVFDCIDQIVEYCFKSNQLSNEYPPIIDFGTRFAVVS